MSLLSCISAITNSTATR